MNKGQYPIIILHGWGTQMSGSKYQEAQELLEKEGFKVYAPDLPGFGSQKLLKPVMDLDDYVNFVTDFMKKQNIKKAIFIGHSFGGRISAKLAYKNPELVEKLILTGAPLIKRKLSFKKSVLATVSRQGKKIVYFLPGPASTISRKVLYKLIGEWDYYKAGDLRETFKKIISEDLSPILPKIKVPTLVLWGDNDTFVPVKDGKDIAHAIPGSKLILVANATHKLPYEKPKEFVKEVISFL